MAVEALREAGRPDQAVVGLAKRLEEVFIPGQSEPLLIAKTSASLKLLQQVRDEAHRFAITFQRSKRKKHLEASWLDEVPGIGDKTKMKLLRAFGSPGAVAPRPPRRTRTGSPKAECKALAQKIRIHLEGAASGKRSQAPQERAGVDAEVFPDSPASPRDSGSAIPAALPDLARGSPADGTVRSPLHRGLKTRGIPTRVPRPKKILHGRNILRKHWRSNDPEAPTFESRKPFDGAGLAAGLFHG